MMMQGTTELEGNSNDTAPAKDDTGSDTKKESEGTSNFTSQVILITEASPESQTAALKREGAVF